MSTLSVERFVMPSASLGPDNPLPDIQFHQDAHAEIPINRETVSEEESRYMGWGHVNGILPYTIHNNYNRTLRSASWKAIVLENEYLRATFLPELGARLWSLIDKRTEEELLHRNPVFQPCNLGLRNAWISGGVEWNLGIIGHTPFTVDSLYAEQLSLEDGTPVVRFYQYERVRHLLYRVEACLPDGSQALFVRVRIDNAGDEDTAVYWWSNMAVNEGDGVRVIVPATKAFRWGYGGALSKVPVPESKEFTDISYPKNLPHSMDYFFDLPDGQRRWIAAVGPSGKGFCQSSTARLKGRKLFAWGMGPGGRHWQEFLSVPGSAYIEIQAGLAHTQLEHLPMAGGETISWLETYSAVQADSALVHGKDWQTATRAVEEGLNQVVALSSVEAMHAKMAKGLDHQNGELLHEADGWGCLEQIICGKESFHSGALRFPDTDMGEAELEWLSLIKNGALPCPAPSEPPKGYQVNDRWFARLKTSLDTEAGNHWFSWYHMGVILAYRNRTEEARQAFERSVELSPSPWALRCLAVLDQQAGDLESACDRYVQALQMSSQRNLAVEAVSALNAGKRYEEALRMLDNLPEDVQDIGRMKILRIEALLATGDLEAAEALLEGSIVLTDVKEGEVTPSRLWFTLQAAKKAREEGVECTEEMIAEAARTLTPPKHLDFRMK